MGNLERLQQIDMKRIENYFNFVHVGEKTPTYFLSGPGGFTNLPSGPFYELYEHMRFNLRKIFIRGYLSPPERQIPPNRMCGAYFGIVEAIIRAIKRRFLRVSNFFG